MAQEDLKLRALELAIEQVRRENAPNFKEAVAELQTWFYNRIIGEVKVESKPLSLPPKPGTGQAVKRP